jgi:hypothetical protein
LIHAERAVRFYGEYLMDRHREEELPGRRSMLRAFIDRLRSRGDARRRRTEIEQGRHIPGEPLILSEEGSREVMDEIKNGSPLTPERRAMFERIRVREAVRKRQAEIEQGRHFPGEPVILSEEGSREVLDEIKNGSPLTPERRETFELMRQMAGVRKRRPGSAQHLEQKS